MEGRKCVDDIERVILMVTSKLQLNCSGLLSTRPDISSPRTAFVAYPGSGSTYIRWNCDFPLFDRIRYSTYIGWACNKGLMCFSGDPLQLQHNITLTSGLVDLLFFCRQTWYLSFFYTGKDKSQLCRLMLELASGKTTVMGEAGDGWFSVFASSPTLFTNLCIVSTWFHILTNLS